MTDLRDAQRLIVFGGSFDPPHLAHVALPELVRQKIGADLVAYVPAGRAPHKLDQPQTPAHHRLAMLRLALADSPRCVILTDEIERASQGLPSYTVDTLEALRGRLGPNVRMWLLIGADQWRIFSQWKSPRRIMELAQPLVMIRPPDTAESLSASLPQEAV
ncbi:MAG TPA: nicotinate (nicotinamide) nucleotide adenylyltransferase, partial [Phycisphaeraceae bacterium]